MKDDTGKEIPQWIVLKGVEVLRKELPYQTILDIRAEMKEDPEYWYAKYHFSWGMAIRNLFRQEVCSDEELPSHNWDDVYVHVIEEAVK